MRAYVCVYVLVCACIYMCVCVCVSVYVLCNICSILLSTQTYYHGEPIKVNVSIRNGSSKTIKKIRITGTNSATHHPWCCIEPHPPIVRQLAYLCLFAQTEYKCDVATLESEWVTLHTAGKWNFVVHCLNEKIYFYTKTFLKKSETCKLEVDFFAEFFVVSCHYPLLCNVHVDDFWPVYVQFAVLYTERGFPFTKGEACSVLMRSPHCYLRTEWVIKSVCYLECFTVPAAALCDLEQAWAGFGWTNQTWGHLSGFLLNVSTFYN